MYMNFLKNIKIYNIVKNKQNYNIVKTNENQFYFNRSVSIHSFKIWYINYFSLLMKINFYIHTFKSKTQVAFDKDDLVYNKYIETTWLKSSRNFYMYILNTQNVKKQPIFKNSNELSTKPFLKKREIYEFTHFENISQNLYTQQGLSLKKKFFSEKNKLNIKLILELKLTFFQPKINFKVKPKFKMYIYYDTNLFNTEVVILGSVVKYLSCVNKNFKKNIFKNHIKLFFEKTKQNKFFDNCGFTSNKFILFLLVCLHKNKKFKVPMKHPYKNIYYNNYYPFFLEKNHTTRILRDWLKNVIDFSIAPVTHGIFLNTLETNFKRNFYIKFDTNYFLKIDPYNFKLLRTQDRYLRTIKTPEFKLEEFHEIFAYSFFLKDTKILSDYLLLIYETMPVKLHKKFTLTIRNIFLYNSDLIFQNFNIKGFYLDYKGKIGATKNAKKSRIYFTFGQIKSSTKTCKLDYQYKTVSTIGGTLGLKLAIAF